MVTSMDDFNKFALFGWGKKEPKTPPPQMTPSHAKSILSEFKAHNKDLKARANPNNTLDDVTPRDMAVGVMSGPRDQNEMSEVNRKSISNLLIPGVAPYRLGRRLAGTE